MEVLVLAWDAVAGGGPGQRAAGLASALGRHGADVRLVTRLAEGEDPAVLRHVEVHDVPDTAPVLPASMPSRSLRALGFASPALAVAVRRLEERSVDLTVAVGRDARAVAERLPTGAGVRVLDVDPTDARADAEDLTAVAQRLRRAGRRVVVSAPTTTAVDVARGVTGPDAVLLPAAGPAPRARPGPPPPAGPVRLVVGPTTSHRAAARRLRAVLDAGRVRRVITGSARYRPAVAVVLDRDDGDAVLRGAGSGVPVVALPGVAGDLVVALRCGRVVPDERAAADACVELLADHDAASRTGDDALAASERARRDAVATLARVVAPATAEDGTGGRPLLRPVE